MDGQLTFWVIYMTLLSSYPDSPPSHIEKQMECKQIAPDVDGFTYLCREPAKKETKQPVYTWACTSSVYSRALNSQMQFCRKGNETKLIKMSEKP